MYADISSSQLEHLNQQIRDLRQELEIAKRSSATLPGTPQDDFAPIITSSPRDQTLEDVSLSGQDIAKLFDMYAYQVRKEMAQRLIVH